ncbi:MAG TPA: DMT family transporter [Gaiellaceae bacterium]|nr:DMT family transporter [Gaiellaceae bacterium]
MTPPSVLDAEERRSYRKGQLAIVLAALAWSTAGVLQRQLSVDTVTQLSGRAVFSCLALLGFVAVLNRGQTFQAFRTMGRAGLAVAVCVAVASGSFVVALNQASVANVLFMQAVSPIAAAVLAWITLGDPITRRAMGAMIVAVLGVGLMVGGPDSGGVVGVAVSFVMTLAFAVSLVITRHRRDISMAPAICLSQALVFAVTAPFATPSSLTGHDVGYLALLGVGQMALGLAFFTVGARLIPATEVALISLLEIVLGPLWVWIALGERPAPATIAGGAIVLGAVLLQTTQRLPVSSVRRRAAAPDAAG